MLAPAKIEERRRHLEARLRHAHERLRGDMPDEHRTWKTKVLIPDILDALERINQNIYGICERCDESIPLARLMVRPEARNCVSCQEANEKEREHAA